MSNDLIIENKALFIADAHYPHHNSILLKLLQKIKSGEIETKQLFLMGDIFDLLFGGGEYVYDYNKEAIEYINCLSDKISIIYLEGNHDFYLKKIFPKIKVIPRDKQPLCINDVSGRLFCFSHGDKYETGILYDIYSAIIRNPLTISILKVFEKRISKKMLYSLSKKDICKKIRNFDDIIKKILKHYPENAIVIEGHFHQGIKKERYISLPSLACDNLYTLYLDGEFIFHKI